MVPFDKESEKEKSRYPHLEEKVLILHNDDINTFEHVIECLQLVCKHNMEQAEQCAIITHFNGYCEIKKGIEEELKKMKQLLLEQDLEVSIF